MLVDLPLPVSILLKITLVLGVGWMLHLILVRCNPRWRVLLWRGVVAGVVLVPILVPLKYLQVPITAPPEPAERTVIPQPLTQTEPLALEIFDSPREIVGTPPLASVPDSPPPTSRSFEPNFSISTWARENIYPMIFSVWGFIALLITARFLTVLVKIRKNVKSSLPAPNHLQHLLDEVAADLNCSQKISLRYSPDFTSPFLAGLTSPVIVLPERMLRPEHADELPAIFAHEVAHLCARDLFWMFAARWLSTALWFHPLIWKLRDAHNAACEEVCDAVAADYVGNPESYSNTLVRIALEIAGKIPSIGGIPMARSSQIIGRLRILKRKIYSLPLARHWVVLSLLVGFVSLIGFGGLKLVYAKKSETKVDVPANLKEGLVLYYSFDNDKGRKVSDLSGKGNHGKVSSGTYVSNGKIGRAMYFDGDGDYIDIGDDSSIQTDVFTLTAWIKTSDTRPIPQFKDRPILSFADLSYVVGVMPDGDVRYEVSREKLGGVGTTDVRTGQWVFVAVTRDSDDEGSIYINGKLENSFHCDVDSRFTYTGKIGGDYAHHEYFNGTIDEVRIYNRALSTSQIKQLYNTTNRPAREGVVAKDIRIDRDRPLGLIYVTGTARDEKGKAVPDALVTLLPGGNSARKEFRTDAEGRFSGHYSLRFDLRGIYINGVYVWAHHRQRNLAAVVRIRKAKDQELELTLTEPATLTGRISDPDGNPIRQASIGVCFGSGRWGTCFAGSVRGDIAIDDEGSFEVKSVPNGCFYEIRVKAEGYGYRILDVGNWQKRKKSIDLGRIVLDPANLSVSGIVVNENGEPVANADISLWGKEQRGSFEWTQLKTDTGGNFRIRNLCPGTITIWAHAGKHGKYSETGKKGELEAKAGEEDVRIVVKDMVREPETPKPLPKPLIGKKLPDFQGIKIDFDSEQARGKRLLIYFLRMGYGSEAGESRHCLMKLVRMAEELEKKDIRVLVVYDGSKDKESLADLKYSIPFPVGIFEGEIENVTFKWGLRGWWPRAILTDRDHTVISEGGGWQVIRGLDKKLKTTQGNPAAKPIATGGG
jgi:beta-lactamase regulating signal transducer with metallopeptidase domain/protocatechuate 3,4-dioxygenase beta subunit